MSQSQPQRGGELEGRSGTVWQLYAVKRWTQDRIGQHLGISQQRVSQILADIRDALPAPDKAEMIRKSIELHENVVARMQELADMEGAPVTAGKDGDVVRDPESDTVVRDYAGRVNALRLALAAEAELRKLLGLDAATKTESTAVVRFSIEGVDPEELA